jgi:hypothetical protein
VFKLIQFYCSKINKVEWSGILFYEIKGSIRKPKSLKICCKDIYLMNKGTATYTSFDTDTSIARYMLANKLLGCKMGLIHSHNTMGTFFSGEDMDELHTTAPVHNFFLSLIVNNFGDAVAKVAFIGDSENIVKEKYYARDENGEPYLMETKDTVTKSSKLYMYDCNVIQPKFKAEVDNTYTARLATIEDIATKRQAAIVAKSVVNKTNYTQPQGYIPNLLPAPTPTNFGYFQEANSETLDQAFDLQVQQISKDEGFFTFCLRLGKFNAEDTIEDCISDMESYNMNSVGMKTVIIDSLSKFYCQYYDMHSESDISISKYVQLLQMFHSNCTEDQLERGEDPNEFLTVFLPALQSYIDKCKMAENTSPTAK